MTTSTTSPTSPTRPAARATTNGLTSPTTRGFTSQEEIAALCLVNLNARIYDPTIARFMAADTMIPDAYDGQSYNRYTYTDNRPLSVTDTTGHDPSCIGVCGSNWNPGSQADGNVDQSAHPEMEVLGSFAISESGNLADGVTAIHITYNVSGESTMAQDPTKGEVAISEAGTGNQDAPNSNSNYKATAEAAAAQNVQAGAVSAVGAEPATAPEVASRSVEMAPADRMSALVAEVASQGGMPASDTPDTDMTGKTAALKQYLMPDGRVIKLTAEYFASLGQSNGTSGQYRYFDDRASMNTFLNAPGADGNTNFQGGWSERFGNSNEAGLVTWMYGGAANPGWSGSHNLNYHFDGSNHTIAVDAAKMVQITYSHEFSHIYLHYLPNTIGEEQANKYGLQKAGLYP